MRSDKGLASFRPTGFICLKPFLINDLRKYLYIADCLDIYLNMLGSIPDTQVRV